MQSQSYFMEYERTQFLHIRPPTLIRAPDFKAKRGPASVAHLRFKAHIPRSRSLPLNTPSLLATQWLQRRAIFSPTGEKIAPQPPPRPPPKTLLRMTAAAGLHTIRRLARANLLVLGDAVGTRPAADEQQQHLALPHPLVGPSEATSRVPRASCHAGCAATGMQIPAERHRKPWQSFRGVLKLEAWSSGATSRAMASMARRCRGAGREGLTRYRRSPIAIPCGWCSVKGPSLPVFRAAHEPRPL